MDGRRDGVSADHRGRKGVGGGPHLDWHASMQLTSSRVRLLRGISSGGEAVLYSERSEERTSGVVFCGRC